MKSFSIFKFRFVLFFLIFCLFATNCSDDSSQDVQPRVDVSLSDLNFGIVNINENSQSQVVEISTENLNSSLKFDS